MLLTLSTCMLESQALAPDGRGGPSLKTSDLPSCVPCCTNCPAWWRPHRRYNEQIAIPLAVRVAAGWNREIRRKSMLARVTAMYFGGPSSTQS